MSHSCQLPWDWELLWPREQVKQKIASWRGAGETGGKEETKTSAVMSTPTPSLPAMLASSSCVLGEGLKLGCYPLVKSWFWKAGRLKGRV